MIKQPDDRKVVVDIFIHIDIKDAKTKKRLACNEKKYTSFKKAVKDLQVLGKLENK